MTRNEALERIPREGFIKLTRGTTPALAGKERSALIRKGNELYNSGRVDAAKRVFLTARYGDGLGRVGDYYLAHGDPLEALRMYWLAPAPDKIEKLIERISSVVQSWMTEGEGVDEKRGSV